MNNMNIAVLVKQTPDTGCRIKIADTGQTIDESCVKWTVSPYDEFALEAALTLKPLLNAKVFTLSAGPSRVKEVLRHSLALGADEAIHIETKGDFSDPLTQARILSERLKALPDISVIFCGKLSVDANNFAVPQMSARFLDFPFVTNVSSLRFENNFFHLTRECGGGAEEKLKAAPPLMISADKGLNKPRYPALSGIMKAKSKPLRVFPAEDISETAKKPKILSLSYPKEKPPPEMIAGAPEEQIKKLLYFLREKENIL